MTGLPDSPIGPVRRVNDAVVVDVQGDIDLRRSVAFQNELSRVLSERPRRLVINLSGVSYMDSSGIASLVKILSRTRKHSIDLRLCELSDRVQSLFEITRLNSVFKIVATEQEALAPK
jgi:anti-sigma B factor antagonist